MGQFDVDRLQVERLGSHGAALDGVPDRLQDRRPVDVQCADGSGIAGVGDIGVLSDQVRGGPPTPCPWPMHVDVSIGPPVRACHIASLSFPIPADQRPSGAAASGLSDDAFALLLRAGAGCVAGCTVGMRVRRSPSWRS